MTLYHVFMVNVDNGTNNPCLSPFSHYKASKFRDLHFLLPLRDTQGQIQGHQRAHILFLAMDHEPLTMHFPTRILLLLVINQ